MELCLSCLVFLTFFGIIKSDESEHFDADYYFSSSLRTTNDCSLGFKIYCQLHCKDDNVICLSGKCYYVKMKATELEEKSLSKSDKEDTIELALRPTLRHHIAHFCPNLEVARACIQKCMQEGLPAFCGKDHVCYCGHEYSNTDINPKTDAKAVYNQFKDLYTKYFGPEPSNRSEDYEELK